MTEKKKKIKLSEKDLDKVTGGIDEFFDAEDLQLTPKEKKELKRKKDKENEAYN